MASALVNSTQQTGGTLGAALINTIATTATLRYLAAHGTSAAAVAAGAMHGYTTAFAFSAVVLALAAAAALRWSAGPARGAPNAAAGRWIGPRWTATSATPSLVTV